MKKSLIFLVALFLLGGISAQAQFKWGLKAGANLSELSTEGTRADIKNATGFQVGPTAEFMIPIVGFGVDAAVLYSQDGFKVEDKTIANLQIPVNLKYKLSLLGLAGVYAAAGPYVNFKLSDNVVSAAKNESFGAGLNFGVGVELLSHLQVGATYQLGLTDDYKNTSAAAAFKGQTRGWIVSAAYFF
jgi:hypothetical protein